MPLSHFQIQTKAPVSLLGERKAFHADEINDASQGTFWRFE